MQLAGLYINKGWEVLYVVHAGDVLSLGDDEDQGSSQSWEAANAVGYLQLYHTRANMRRHAAVSNAMQAS